METRGVGTLDTCAQRGLYGATSLHFFFCSILTKHMISRFKVELRNCFKGWSVQRPLLNGHELKHVANMHTLYLGLAIFDAKQG